MPTEVRAHAEYGAGRKARGDAQGAVTASAQQPRRAVGGQGGTVECGVQRTDDAAPAAPRSASPPAHSGSRVRPRGSRAQQQVRGVCVPRPGQVEGGAAEPEPDRGVGQERVRRVAERDAAQEERQIRCETSRSETGRSSRTQRIEAAGGLGGGGQSTREGGARGGHGGSRPDVRRRRAASPRRASQGRVAPAPRHGDAEDRAAPRVRRSRVAPQARLLGAAPVTPGLLEPIRRSSTVRRSTRGTACPSNRTVRRAAFDGRARRLSSVRCSECTRCP